MALAPSAVRGAPAIERDRSAEASRRDTTLPALAYLIRMFPQTSETFIANEVLELERLGARITVFSYRRPRESVTHAVLRTIRAAITYLPDPLYRHPFAIARSVWNAARSQP